MKFKDDDFRIEISVGAKVTVGTNQAICTAYDSPMCDRCLFDRTGGCSKIACMYFERTDSQRVYFKEVVKCTE